MIITPKQPRDENAVSRLSKLVPYMLQGKGEERCTWYMAGNLEGVDRRKDAQLAIDVMELIQDGNVRAGKDKTYHLVISFHPEDRRLTHAELEDVVRRALRAAGLEQHQYIAVRHSEQEHVHVHVGVNKIHPVTLKIHHPYRAIPAFQALASMLEDELGLHRVDRTRSRSSSHRARNFEAHHRLESFARWARRRIGDTLELDRIDSWPALHEALGRFAVRLVPRGNGLALVDASRPNLACKASSLGRGWSKQRLSARLGAFVEGPSEQEVNAMKREAYEPEALGPARDDGLWREYQVVLEAARARRAEHREAVNRKVAKASDAHRRRFKLRHHLIAVLPISGRDKRKLYKMLAFERKAAKSLLESKIKRWRKVNTAGHPGSWKQFLADSAARGDERAIRRLRRAARRPAIQVQKPRALPFAARRTSRGTVVHNLPGGVRLLESAGAIELLGEPRDDALEQLVAVAQQRLGAKRISLRGPQRAQRRLAELAAERGFQVTQERER